MGEGFILFIVLEGQSSSWWERHGGSVCLSHCISIQEAERKQEVGQAMKPQRQLAVMHFLQLSSTLERFYNLLNSTTS